MLLFKKVTNYSRQEGAELLPGAGLEPLLLVLIFVYAIIISIITTIIITTMYTLLLRLLLLLLYCRGQAWSRARPLLVA